MKKKKSVLIVKDNGDCEGIIKTGFTFNSDEVLKKAFKIKSIEGQLTYLVDCWLLAQKQAKQCVWKVLDDLSDCGGSYGIDEALKNEKEKLDWELSLFKGDILPHIEARRKILKIPKEKGLDKRIDELQTNVIKSKMAGIKPIRWTGKDTQLIYLTEQLRLNGFLQQATDTTKIIKDHFVDENGKEFKNIPQKWRNVKNNKNNKCRNANLIDTIVEETKKKK
jgi:hypothetical protein